jgi:hypothetical protein
VAITFAAPTRGLAAEDRYTWEGDVQPGTRLQFVQVLLPHAPREDATSLARGISVLADEPGVAVVQVASEQGLEWAVLNPAARPLSVPTSTGAQLKSDAHAVYLHQVGDAISQVYSRLCYRGERADV